MAIQLKFKCNESWESMSASDRGRFCDKCTKNVFDLTHKSDAEIKQLYAENNGKMCGKIKQSQLAMPFMSEQKRVLAKFCFALYLVFGSLMFSNMTSAQSPVSLNINQVESTDSIYIIEGVVTDELTGEPISLVHVAYQVDTLVFGGYTDEKGRYLFEVKRKDVEKKNLTLYFSILGYESITMDGIVLSQKRIIDINTTMKYPEHILLGDIMIEEDPVTK